MSPDSTSTRWRKSSYSNQNINSDCVELAELRGVVGIRDSKNPGNGHLGLSRTVLAALVDGIKA